MLSNYITPKKSMQKPSLREENRLWRKGYKWVAGIDEAGMGPLAGPVTAAVVMLPRGFKNPYRGVFDSKKLTSEAREYFYGKITQHSDISYAVSSVGAKAIDRIGIRASLDRAMERSLGKLSRAPDFLLLDGKVLTSRLIMTQNYLLKIRGDEKMLSCALASIIAKVTRDRIMLRAHNAYPEYGLKNHKGYGTRAHIRIIKKRGPSPLHRISYLSNI